VSTLSASSASENDDEIRERLLAAAARVFARQGYEGTKISDIVREADLSTGAVYGRFRSKNDLLRAAVVERAAHVAHLGGTTGDVRVADLLVRSGRVTSGSLTDDEAVRLEAFVAARREPEVAQALVDATQAWRRNLQPFVDAALDDGTLSPTLDPEAVLFFLRAIGLGLLVQRAAGLPAPSAAAWDDLLARVVDGLGDGTNGRTRT
jgi:AcrR family transcriptional regulator